MPLPLQESWPELGVGFGDFILSIVRFMILMAQVMMWVGGRAQWAGSVRRQRGEGVMRGRQRVLQRQQHFWPTRVLGASACNPLLKLLPCTHARVSPGHPHLAVRVPGNGQGGAVQGAQGLGGGFEAEPLGCCQLVCADVV